MKITNSAEWLKTKIAKQEYNTHHDVNEDDRVVSKKTVTRKERENTISLFTWAGKDLKYCTENLETSSYHWKRYTIKKSLKNWFPSPKEGWLVEKKKVFEGLFNLEEEINF